MGTRKLGQNTGDSVGYRRQLRGGPREPEEVTPSCRAAIAALLPKRSPCHTAVPQLCPAVINTVRYKAISRKRCKIGGKLLLITNRKSYMGFRLLPNSVTLDNLERRNSPNRRVISPNSIALSANYVKVVEDTPVLTAAEM